MSQDPPHLRPTGRSLPIALLRARETVMGPIREMLIPAGVSEQKWRILRVLQERGPCDLTSLAAESCLLLPSLTRLVRPLEQDGLIARRVPRSDRRRVVVAITPAGAALLAAHAAESAAIFARIEAGFGRDRLEMLLDLLESLQALNLRDPGSGPAPPPGAGPGGAGAAGGAGPDTGTATARAPTAAPGDASGDASGSGKVATPGDATEPRRPTPPEGAAGPVTGPGPEG